MFDNVLPLKPALEAAAPEPGGPDGDRQDRSHPAVTAVFLREFAEWLDRALGNAPRERARLADLFRQLDEGADRGAWWPDLYPLLQAILLRDEK